MGKTASHSVHKETLYLTGAAREKFSAITHLICFVEGVDCKKRYSSQS